MEDHSIVEEDPEEQPSTEDLPESSPSEELPAEEQLTIRRNTRPLPPLSRSVLGQRLATRQGLMILVIGSLVLIILAGLGAWYVGGALGLPGVNRGKVDLGVELTPPASLSELATEFPEMAGILLDPKLDSAYKDFLVAFQQGGEEAAYELAQKRGLLNARDELRMTLELDISESADTAALQAELEAHGILVTAVSGNLMDIAIPLEVLQQAIEAESPGALFEDISGLEHILRIRLPIVNVQDVGGVETESLGVIGASGWQAAGFTGKGVKVGILDGGFDGYKNLLGSDLPADAVVKSFIAGLDADQTGSVHGSAVAEIVHDIAPDAQLYLVAYDTDAEGQLAVDWLISQGVRIISHSRSKMYGPMDGTSLMAQIVDRAVEQGVLWVNSAGNTGYTHYRAHFVDTDGDGFHEFSPGDELMGFRPSGQVILILNWDDWGNGTQDFDLYVLDGNGNELVSSTNTQNGPGDDSAEVIVYEFPDDGPYYLAFKAVHVDRDIIFNFFMRDGVIEYYTPEYSVTTPGDARHSLTVGAVNWSDDKLEDYSSQGPTSDGRMKPDLVAPAGVSSAAYGSTWIGTSASTPHVSGAAALVLQAFPDFTPAQVTDYLESHATDLGVGGPDNVFGFGRLYLGPVPSMVGPPSGPTPAASLVSETTASATTSSGTPVASQTLSASTATPARETPIVFRSPVGASSEADMGVLALGLLACVFLPGILGLGGVVLVGSVWYSNRTAKARRIRERGRLHGPGEGSLVRYPERGFPDGRLIPPAPRPGAASIAGGQAGEPGAAAVCPRCGSPHRPEARFCNMCGYVLQAAQAGQRSPKPVFCQYCGRPLRPESRFCSNCGKPRRQ